MNSINKSDCHQMESFPLKGKTSTTGMTALKETACTKRNSFH